MLSRQIRMNTPEMAMTNPMSDFRVMESFKKIIDRNTANAGTSEKMVCATDGSMRETVKSDKLTPKVGPKIVPAIAYLTPLSLLDNKGCTTSFSFPAINVKKKREMKAADNRINVASKGAI